MMSLLFSIGFRFVRRKPQCFGSLSILQTSQCRAGKKYLALRSTGMFDLFKQLPVDEAVSGNRWNQPVALKSRQPGV
jgi:hypothetical protein